MTQPIKLREVDSETMTPKQGASILNYLKMLKIDGLNPESQAINFLYSLQFLYDAGLSDVNVGDHGCN